MTSRPVATGAAAVRFVCRLEELEDERSAGGKAWNLGRMRRLDIPVPAGVALTDAAFQTFLDENRLRDGVSAILAATENSSVEAVRNAAAEIHSLVRSATLPGVIREAVLAAPRELRADEPLIVRSSAVGEDSAGHSFAGQFDSFADVRSAEGLESAVLACWASCWSERALRYQLARALRVTRMGVVIQEQVRSRMSGVLFTVSPDPSIGASEMLAEYCLGPGDALVAGRINPGRFTISREGARFALLSRPEQPDAEGSGHLPLDPNIVRELHRIGLALEREFRGAQDIEWTIDPAGRLQIVQSRPITTPAGTSKATLHQTPPAAASTTIWSNANINENYPGPVSPFLYSVAADGYYHYFRNLASAFGISAKRIRAMESPLRNIIGVHGARLYYNLTNIHAALRMAPFGDHLVEFFNLFVGAREHAAQPPAAESFQDRRRGRLLPVAELARIAVKTSWQFLFVEKRVAQFERTADGYARRTHPDILARMPLPELQGALRSFLDIRCRHWTNASLADTAAMVCYGLLQRLIRRGFPEQADSALHNRLLQGLPDLASARPVNALWDLSRRIRADASLRTLFATCDGDKTWDALQREERFSKFRGEFDVFLEQWGFRCSGELMLTVRSFQEDPRSALSILRGYAEIEGQSPVEALQRQAADRIAETRRIGQVLKQKRILRILPWPHEGTAAKVVLRMTQAAIALRERARLKQSLLYSRCRRVLLRIGEELVTRGFLEHPEDVFFLAHQELDALISGSAMFPQSIRALIALRRAEHARLGRMALPDTLALPAGGYLDPDAPPGAAAPTDDPGLQTTLLGTGACGGTVTARACVLSDVTDSERLTAGDILVTRQTDPGWAPVFFMVRGLIMERGGMLSHGAIIAREYGIPTVVGVVDATRRIRSGQTVRVDGDAGHVQLLD